MNFASPYVLNDAIQTDNYEVVSDDEFNEGIDLSDSGSDEEISSPRSSAEPGVPPQHPPRRLPLHEGLQPLSARPRAPDSGEDLAQRLFAGQEKEDGCVSFAAHPPPPPLPPHPQQPPKASGLGHFLSRLGAGSRRTASEPKPPRLEAKKSKMHSWKSSERSCSDGRPAAAPSAGEKGEKKKRVFRRAHTNVVSIRFDTLKKPSAMHAGEAISCSNCQAIMSHISQITEDGPDKVWKCEFCGTQNRVEIEEEEKPTADDVTYLVEPALATETMSTSGRDESIVIFCIDTSGSMTITTEVPGHLKLRGSSALRRLQRESSREGPQHLPRESRNVTYISRLQAVQAAVDHQLGEMAKEFPDRRIALITFSCEVCVIGDGTGEATVVTGAKLNDKDELAKIGASFPAPKPIKQTRASLGEKIFGLEEGGATALGPALIIALNMAAQHPGSKVILCTDGKSNEGVGKVENLQEDDPPADDFYESIAKESNNKGVSMSVITIKGTDCKLIHLGKLADNTGGQVNTVDPLKLTEEFSNVLADRIIAMNVTATFILHYGLYIGKEENEASKEKRVIGNVRADHEISFEYGVRRKKVIKSPKKPPASELAHISEVPSFMEVESLRRSAGEEHVYDNALGGEGNPADTPPPPPPPDIKETAAGGDNLEAAGAIPSELPFQLQIQYTDVDGTKALRVLTQKKPVTTDRKVAEKDADLKVLGVHTQRLASELALQGDYTASRGVALMNHRLGWRSSRDSEDKMRVYKAAYSGVKSVENRVLSRQKKEVSTYGHTHSDDEDDNETAPLPYTGLSIPPLPPANRMMKKHLRTEETEDDFACELYQYRSTSTAHMDKETMDKLRSKIKKPNDKEEKPNDKEKKPDVKETADDAERNPENNKTDDKESEK